MIDLLKRLDSHFQNRGSQIALSDDPSRHGIDYRHLDQYSGRVYRYLKDRGIGREDFVMLCLPRGVRFPIAMVGVWKAGAAFVVCEDTYAPERIRFIQDDSECKLVISEENWAEIMQTEYLPGRETVDPHDLAYAVYTSGTTGSPKGVLHEYGNLDESCGFKKWDGERLLIGSDVLALNAPMNFVAAQDYINNVLYSGATLFVVSYAHVKNPPALIELYEEIGATCTFMTPSAFRLLPALNSQMRWIVLGGELCAGLYKDGVLLLNGYNIDYQLYAPGSIMWNMPRCWKFSKNDVDPDRLAAAFEKVLNAHPVFRTLLRYDENYELVQHYEETLPVKVDIEQVLGTLDADTLLQYVQPFRLLGEPMYRAKLLETDESICLFLDMHHIICDGVSMQVLANDLTKAYEGREPETDYYFLSLRDQYKNVISDDYIRAKEYFENQYGGKEWVYGLTPEKESRKSAFDRVVMPLGISEEDLAAYLSSAGISRNAFLQTVALLTIARMENAKNVMLGWVYSGRDEQKKQSAVGLLIREIPLGLSLDELTDIRSLYESVKKQMSQGLVNRDYPYLTANASVAVNDVFCFIDEGDILDLRVFGDIPCEEIPLAATNALGWMMALTFFNGDGIFMCMNYTSVRYNRETMERYCEIYQQIAAKLMKSRPKTAVNEILG